MRAVIAVIASMSMFGCGTVLRPLTATDAAAALEQVTHSKTDQYDPAIAPDGRAIAYDAAQEDGARHVEVMSLAQPNHIVYTSANVSASEPAWMPDASSVVFVDGASKSKIVQTFGMGERPVFLADVGDSAFAASRPAVSPNGKLVAMSLDDLTVRRTRSPTVKHYDQAIGVTDLLGTGLKVIGRGTDPTFSSDGTHIAFARVADGHSHLFVSKANGRDAMQITTGPDDDQNPTFSPNGRVIAFCSVHGDAKVTQSNLFTVNVDGSSLVQLTEGDHHACHPSWGRDGFIYFHADEGRRFHIWRLRPREGR